MSRPNGLSINSASPDTDEDTKALIPPDTVPRQCCSARLNLALLMCCGFAVVYGLRVNLSVAMVAMVNVTEAGPRFNSSVPQACPRDPKMVNVSQAFSQMDGIPQYQWDAETQGWLLGAFFFGYLCTQVVGGYLAGHYGGSAFLGGGVLGTAALTLLTPLAAQWGPSWLFALRALEGIGEGVTFPAMMAMWARWAPPLERARLMTLSGSGGNLGAFVALPLTGFICQTLGWPSVFYCCGAGGCVWAVLWFLYASNDPRTHRRISEEEREYIVNSVGPQGTAHGWSVPLCQMMLSGPLWAIIIAQMCSNWSYYTLLTSLPTFMDNILHFDLKSNGFLSALPYLGALVVSLVSGVAADALLERRLLSITAVRKIFTAAGLLPCAAFLVSVNYVGCSSTLAITLLSLSTTLGSISAAGVYMNQIDIAPRYAGFLLGITNTFGTIPGIIAPILNGYFTEDHSLEGWRNVFWVAAAMNVAGAVVYLLLGSGRIQPWAVMEEERAEVESQRGKDSSS